VRAHSGGTDAFAAKLTNGGALTWNTFLGGSGYDYSSALTVDGSGNVYVVGYSNTTWGSPVQAYGGGNKDAFAAKLASGGSLTWHTFLGGNDDDTGYAVAVDNGGNVYVAGTSDATWGSPVRAHLATLVPMPLWPG
jgi:predicted secreted hydrolase